MTQDLSVLVTREPSSVSEALKQAFGSTFENADLCQLFALMESISFLMRQPDASIGNAVTAVIPDVKMPASLHFCRSTLMDFGEGLNLMAVIYTVTASRIALLDSDGLTI